MVLEYYTYTVPLSQCEHKLFARNISTQPCFRELYIPRRDAVPALDISFSDEPVTTTYVSLPNDSRPIFNDFIDYVCVPLYKWVEQSHLRRRGHLSLNTFSHLCLGEPFQYDVFVQAFQYPDADAKEFENKLNTVTRGRSNEFHLRKVDYPVDFDYYMEGNGFPRVFELTRQHREYCIRRINERDFRWGNVYVSAQRAGFNIDGHTAATILARLKKD